MYAQAKRNWGMFTVGIVTVIIGSLMLFFPGIANVSADVVFGLVLCCIGVVDLVYYAGNPEAVQTTPWAMLLGIVDLALGVLFLLNPLVALYSMAVLAGIYLCCYGGAQMLAARAMAEMPGSGSIAFSGCTAVFCGVLLFFAPSFYAFVLACYLVVRGITMMVGGVAVDHELEMTNPRRPYGV